MTNGFIVMRNGSQWNILEVVDGEARPLAATGNNDEQGTVARRLAFLLNQFGKVASPMPDDIIDFAGEEGA